MRYTDSPFTDNKDLCRFELQIEDDFAYINYSRDGQLVSLNHTEVPETLKGRGVAETLVEKTFRYVENSELKIVPLCSYIGIFLQRHPEWQKLVAKP